MTRLAVIDLEVEKGGRSGRVFLERDLLERVTIAELEAELARQFIDPDDEDRMRLIEELLRQHETVQVAVFPGEESPPEYHAYVKDPGNPSSRWFACVLAPNPILYELVAEPPHALFETATFQVMAAEASPASMLAAIESWAKRVWPLLTLPKFEVLPWPVEEVHVEQLPLPDHPKGTPRGAPARLPGTDYVLPEELSA